MAWYAELKRRKWHCINGIDMIQIYRKKLYDDWYNSLTDEQKQWLEEYRKEKSGEKPKGSKRSYAKTIDDVWHGCRALPQEWIDLVKRTAGKE